MVAVAVHTQNDDVLKEYTSSTSRSQDNQAADVDIEAEAAEYITDKQVQTHHLGLTARCAKFNQQTVSIVCIIMF